MVDISLFLKLEPHVTNGMSIFQMDHFVIKDHITPYRKLRQAIIEAKARLENITSIGFDIEELKLKQEKALNDSNSIPDSFERKMSNVAIRRFTFEIDRKQAVLDQMEKEVKFFLDTITNIVNTDFDGSEAAVLLMQDSKFHQIHEAEFWTKKLARSVCSDFVNYGTISKGVLESIANLPEEQRRAIVTEATDQQLTFHDMLNKVKDTVLAIRD